MVNRYINTKVVRAGDTGSLYYTNTIYPDIPERDDDYYVITAIEDRLDLLAYDFYQDASLWWIIASANGLPGDSIYPPIGVQLRVPTNVQSAIINFKTNNNAN